VHLHSKYCLGPYVCRLFSDSISTELGTFLSDTIIFEKENIYLLIDVFVLMRIFGPEADAVKKGWKTIKREPHHELHNFLKS
jgi:hypothetical protein